MNNNSGEKPIWILAGEPSGDTYGARLARELQQLRPESKIQGMGGREMKKAGVEILVDSSNLAVVGIAEVVKNLFLFYRIFHFLRRRALEVEPAAVILIDYPGFNLRFAAALHREGIPSVYYVSPQVWAWGRKRVHKIARTVRKMLVLFPFEVEFFSQTDLDVEFVGHPLLEILEENRDPKIIRDDQTVLLLPGSRINEIKRLLPPMLRTASLLAEQHRGEIQFVISLHSSELRAATIKELTKYRNNSGLDSLPEFKIHCGETRYWLQKAAAGIAASGTVTMEAAILGLPLITAYRLHPLTYMLARKLVKVPYITMPNLIADDLVYEEFIQETVKPENMVQSLETILPGGKRREKTKQGMAKVVESLGCGERAGRKAAQAVIDVIDTK